MACMAADELRSRACWLVEDKVLCDHDVQCPDQEVRLQRISALALVNTVSLHQVPANTATS
jgi:hypothetical protein